MLANVPRPEVGPRTLLGRLRAAVRARHYSPRTEESYVGWVRRFVVFHGRRHPDQLGEAEVRAFLEHLAERVRRWRRCCSCTKREEVRAVLAQLRGVARLVGLLLYGSGVRLLECLSLRVKDVDFHR